jgi:hypothetical protein
MGNLTVLNPAFPAEPVHSCTFVLEDVSTHGVRIQTADIPDAVVAQFARGALTAAVELDSCVGAPVRALTLLRWHTSLGDGVHRLGLQFTEISEEHAGRLQRYVFRLLGTAGIALDDDARKLRRDLRQAFPYVIAAAAVITGLLVGHMCAQRGRATDPAFRVARAAGRGDVRPLVGRR